jgi:hypothetical protein
MKNRQRRLKAIELTLTPRQVVVVVWLRNATQAGTLEAGLGVDERHRLARPSRTLCAMPCEIA